MYQIIQFFKFLIQSGNQHGVHSPFVYNLVTQCFYSKTNHEQFSILKKYRKQLNANHQTISVTDFGAGSRVFKSNIRKISGISKTAGISKKRTKLLFRVVKYFSSENILELGTSLGLATSALSLGNPNAKIITIEGCHETAQVAKQQFYDFQLKNIDLKTNNFNIEIAKLPNSNFDLIYIDGNHQKEATLNYFETLLKFATNNSVFIFDDIHWSKQMTEAWEIIKQNSNVTVTIDTFFWGFVFFRKEQSKQHFKIRI